MKSKGFTIVELLVVVGLISVLLTIGVLNFNSWQRKNIVEKNVKELYSDVQEARTAALYTKFRRRIDLAAKQVTFNSYSSDADVPAAVITKQLPLTISWSSWASPASNQIEFNTRGVMTDSSIKVICFQTTDDVAYDALIITPVLTNMGKVTIRGNACGQDNVTQK
jgi:prepilin-type N-terminal cleavage/methylation domain-containing protein